MSEPAEIYAGRLGQGVGSGVPDIRPLPRVSIQEFCETADVQAALTLAFDDRRAARAQSAVQMGGSSAAVDFYEDAPTPNLIIVETMARADSIMLELDRLAEVCDSDTRVVVIGHANDVVLYRDLIRSGVSEYLVAPVPSLEMINTISELFGGPNAAPLGRIVAFIGARGGVGSSTIAHNIAWTLSTDFDTNTVLADLDLPFGTAGLDFNQDPAHGIANAVFSSEGADEQMVERLLFKCTDKLHLFAAPATLERDYDLEAHAFDQILDVARATIPCIVLDLPSLWNAWTRETLLQADEIVVTATPDLASLRNAKNLIDVLMNTRQHDVPPRLLLNQVGVPKRPEISANDFAKAIGIEPMVEIPFEPELFGVAANNGQMVAEVNSNAKVTELFNGIGGAVMGRSEMKRNRSSGLAGLLNKITKRAKVGRE